MLAQRKFEQSVILDDVPSAIEYMINFAESLGMPEGKPPKANVVNSITQRGGASDAEKAALAKAAAEKAAKITLCRKASSWEKSTRPKSASATTARTRSPSTWSSRYGAGTCTTCTTRRASRRRIPLRDGREGAQRGLLQLAAPEEDVRQRSRNFRENELHGGVRRYLRHGACIIEGGCQDSNSNSC